MQLLILALASDLPAWKFVTLVGLAAFVLLLIGVGIKFLWSGRSRRIDLKTYLDSTNDKKK